jgi:protein TonB
VNTLSKNPVWASASENDTPYFLIAIGLSMTFHFLVMHLIPMLDQYQSKPPLNIVAEILTLAPPPPPPMPAENKPIEEMPIKPIEKPIQKEPKPVAKLPDPILTSKSPAQASDYVVPDAPRAEQADKQPSAPVTPAPSATETTETAANVASAKNTSTTNNSAEFSDSDIWDEYGNNLQKLCERNKQYPAIAIRRGYEGSGKVLVKFSADGKASSIAIEKSTGQKSLDDQAIEMVRKSLSELPLPAKFIGKSFKISIPIEFKLE